VQGVGVGQGRGHGDSAGKGQSDGGGKGQVDGGGNSGQGRAVARHGQGAVPGVGHDALEGYAAQQANGHGHAAKASQADQGSGASQVTAAAQSSTTAQDSPPGLALGHKKK
jgi:hypothetical protein